MGRRFWDAQRHDEYVRQRDAALQRQVEEKAGTAVARSIDASWPLVPPDERAVIEFLVLSGARCCIGLCSDPLLEKLVARGMLASPTGVRPVMTGDLSTVFMVPPALWGALLDRRETLFAPEADRARLLEGAARRLAERIAPITWPGEDTVPESGRSHCSPIARATLLVSARLNEAPNAAKPLSLSEYHQLARFLDTLGLTPSGLLRDDVASLMQPYAEGERILALLQRRGEVENLLHHWEQLGIWVLAERDADFPSRLRERLKGGCLPLLFGAGPRSALDQGGLCVVGSRDCPDEARRFAELVGRRAGGEGLAVISSDMRGVDREVVAATLEAGGRIICVLSDSLEKTVTGKRFRDALHAGRATLVTPFTPDIRFAVANAMRANRYQYALSDAAIVVEARQSGGIWSGADENRKHRWVPAFVRTGTNVSPGNHALLHLGLHPLTHPDVEHCASLTHLLVERAANPPPPVTDPRVRPDLYSIFLAELAGLDDATASSEEAVAGHFGIEREQARVWLARARAEMEQTPS